MHNFPLVLPNFIVGGTNKAGTTSIFRYLSDHPQACGSSVKETAFFENKWTGDLSEDRKKLSEFFNQRGTGYDIYFESSTGYLASARRVAPRIQVTLASPKIMFVLRAPADRLLSYFHFQVGRFEIPDWVTFDKYVDWCIGWENSKINARDLPMNKRHLAALRYGNYGHYLTCYYETFETSQIKVSLFENLVADNREFMKDVARFLNIDEKFYANYEFRKSNETYSVHMKQVHAIALRFYMKLERVFHYVPNAKRLVVKAYKKINMAKRGYPEMSSATQDRLSTYYYPDLCRLQRILGKEFCERWS